MAERRRALIVANSDYQDLAFRRLTAPVEDARQLARVLGDPSIGAFDVETLLNEKSGVVNQAIEEFFVFSEPKPDDFLLLYFSGHGVTDEDGQLYFATNDTLMVRQSIRRVTAVAADFVNTTMRRSRARRQVLVLDCCHSGAFAEAMGAKGELPGVETHFQGKGRVVLTASTGAQFSFEGQSSRGLQPSVYTRLLVNALETGEADRDCNGQVDLDELHDYLVEHVRAEAPQQTPTKGGYLEGRIYIARTPRVRAATLPAYLQNAIAASENLTRYGAVFALKELLADANPGMALAARQALETLRDQDDSMKVQAAARDCLAAWQSEQPDGALLRTPSAVGHGVATQASEAESTRRQKAVEQLQNLIRQRDEPALEAAVIAEAERKEEEAKKQGKLRERAEAVRLQGEAAEREEQLTKEKAETKKAADRKAEAKRIVRQKGEAKKAEDEKAEAERVAQETADRKRKRQQEEEKARRDRLAQEAAEHPVTASEKSEGSVGQIVPAGPARASSRVKLGVLGFAAFIAVCAIVLWVARKPPTETSQTVPASDGQTVTGATASGSQTSFPLDLQSPSAGPITKVDLEQMGTLTDPDSNMRTESVAFTPGNRKLLVVALGLPDFKGNGVIRVWDLSTGQVMSTLQKPGADRPEDQFETVALSPDGRLAAVTTYGFGNRKGELLLWDLNTGNLLRDFGQSTDLPYGGEAVTFSPDSSLVAFGDSTGTARIWNTQTGELIQSLKHPNIIGSMAFSNDGAVLAVGDRDWNPSVRLWNTRTWTRERDLHPTQPSYGESIAFSPDGQMVATGHARGGIYLWDYKTGTLLRTLRGPSTENGKPRTLAFNATGEILSFIVNDTLQFWNPSSGKLLSAANIDASWLTLAVSSGKLMATASTQENAVQIWQVHY